MKNKRFDVFDPAIDREGMTKKAQERLDDVMSKATVGGRIYDLRLKQWGRIFSVRKSTGQIHYHEETTGKPYHVYWYDCRFRQRGQEYVTKIDMIKPELLTEEMIAQANELEDKRLSDREKEFQEYINAGQAESTARKKANLKFGPAHRREPMDIIYNKVSQHGDWEYDEKFLYNGREIRVYRQDDLPQHKTKAEKAQEEFNRKRKLSTRAYFIELQQQAIRQRMRDQCSSASTDSQVQEKTNQLNTLLNNTDSNE